MNTNLPPGSFMIFGIIIPRYMKVAGLLTLANFVMLWYRNMQVGDAYFHFLKSNLWSGFIPLFIAFVLHKFHGKIGNFLFWCGAGLWLLFYPNAPYMISDLIHNDADPLSSQLPQLVVFDTLIIFSIAMLSVFYGFISLKIMYHLFTKRTSVTGANIAIAVCLVLSCLGFYMGREISSGTSFGNGYLYSSQFLTMPILVLKDVYGMLFPISAHKPAYEMMALFGIVQVCLIVIMRDIGLITSLEDGEDGFIDKPVATGTN